MTYDYLLIHTSYKTLAEDIKHLTDEYVSKQMPEEDLDKMVLAWDENCPNLLYEDSDKSTLSDSLLRYIGKRRATVIMTALKRAKK